MIQIKLNDITGQTFGRLTVLYRIHKCNKRHAYWLCVCKCGNLTEVRGSHLTGEKIKSCGCLLHDSHEPTYIKHNKTNTKLYSVWSNMKDRCYNDKNHNYDDYGGRGIDVYSEWRNDFMSFYNWAINNGYKEGLSIDRIDVNGNYEPNNCRWATTKQQLRNTRKNIYFTINGETHCLSEWCEILDLKYETIRQRVARGWNIENALELEQKT